MKGEESQILMVKRFVNSVDIGFMEYSFNDKNWKKLSTGYFYIQFAKLGILRIHDPIVSERTCPTSSDLNKLLVQTIFAQDEYKNIHNAKQMLQLVDKDVFSIIQMEQEIMKTAKIHLINLRTIEAALLMKDIQENDKKITDKGHEARAKSHEITLLLNADKYESIQKERFETLEKNLSTAINTQIQCNPTNLTEFNNLLNEFMVTWNKYNDDTESVRKTKEEVQEYLEMNHMKMTLRHWINHKTISVAEFIEDCDKIIKHSKGLIKKTIQHEAWKLLEKVRNNGPKNIELNRKKANTGMAKLKKLQQDMLDKHVER